MISTIDTAYVRAGMAASHLLTENGHAAFIDTGTSHSCANLLGALEVYGISREKVEYVIVTHVHLDHAGGAGALLRALPNARLVVHPRGARFMSNPAKLIAGAVSVYGEKNVQALYGDIVPVPAQRIIKAPDGFELILQGRTLLFLDTPGHARHHFCIVDKRSRGIFTGDTFGLSYREFDTEKGAFIFPATAPVHFEPEAMHASIERLLEYDPERCYLTHYGEITQPQKRAKELHILIDKFVEIAKAAADKKGPDRQTQIEEGLMQCLLSELKQHGCALAEQRVRELLASDISLNAQGLAYSMINRMTNIHH
ncbi:MAG: MBL fold metallo-hydrolase [Gammaproteobacteria bacterium]|nr:MBL fold metallo-hydrolase [Gammaproteobacteria bacterium]